MFPSMTFSPMAIFQRDDRYEGVRRINIYLLRLLYILMSFVLGRDTWTNILMHWTSLASALQVLWRSQSHVQLTGEWPHAMITPSNNRLRRAALRASAKPER
jgi:hypothetical protein